MKFEIKRTVLLNALSKVSRAVSLKSPLPVLTGIKFELLDDGLVLTGSDSDITIQTKITEDINIIETGGVVLSSKYILEIIKKIDSDNVHISILDGTLTRIEGSSSKFDLNGTPVNDYPRVDMNTEGIPLHLRAFLLKTVIEKTSFATSEKETRPVLTGVNFHAKDGKMVAIATDSYRLAQNVIDLEDDQSFNIIVPKKSLTEISRIIEKDEEINVFVDDRKILFVIDDFYILSRLIDGTYPDTSRLISDQYDYSLSVNSSVLLSAIDRASLFSVESTNIVTLNMSPNHVVLSSYSQEIGSVEEDLSASFYKGDELEISFSAKYLADAIKSVGSETVKILFTGTMRPFIIKDVERDDNIQVVLPVRSY